MAPVRAQTAARTAVVAVALAGAGCYAPEFRDGLACSETNACPDGQGCDLGTGRCTVRPDGCPGDSLPFTPRNFDPCTLPEPTGDLTFPNGLVLIDTTLARVLGEEGDVLPIASTLVTQRDGGARALVISARDLTISTDTVVIVRGDWPLVLVGFGTVTLEGAIDASSHGPIPGPGADRGCAVGTGAVGDTRQVGTDFGATGGGGGGYGSAGGRGGDVSPATGTATPAGGTLWGDPDAPLLGGCRGGNGGVGFAGDPPPAAGGGGGGVQLIGGSAIVVDGVITVSGGGGQGAGLDAESGGGGGGGAGGKIVLQTLALTITGALTANGGGGGEGRFEIQTPGANGSDGAAINATPALGGRSGAGGDGGNGGTTSSGAPGRAGEGAVDMPAGGGGGGGGGGWIIFDASQRTIDSESVISPPPVER